MPSAALHPCVPGCPTLLPAGQRYCAAHTPDTSKGWRGDQDRIRGRRLQALRLALYAQEPECRQCHRLLVLDPHQANSMIRDHIVPLFEGGTDAPDNIQPLCAICSRLKTEQESARGVRRSR